MMENNLTYNEAKLAGLLRDEILRSSENLVVQHTFKMPDLSNFELISENKIKEEKKPYVSPIFSMSEDELIAFIEEFDVKELATLTVAELDHMGKVLGLDPMMLIGG